MLRESFTYRPSFPFGETFIDRRSGHDYDNMYKFNGKELDAETGLYYYGARHYDPRISQFYGVDPLAEKYYEWSAYNYVADNPVKLVDPDGRAPQTDYYNLKGQLIKHVEDGKDDKFVVDTRVNPENKKRVQKHIDQALNGERDTAPVVPMKVLKKIKKTVELTKANKKEYLFAIGRGGKVSNIYEGNETNTGNALRKAKHDLALQGDIISYDFHTHPKRLTLTDEGWRFGSYTPADDDIEVQKDRVYTNLSIVFGYKGRTGRYHNDELATPILEEKLSFYSGEGAQYEFNYSRYVKAVEAIHNQN